MLTPATLEHELQENGALGRQTKMLLYLAHHAQRAFSVASEAKNILAVSSGDPEFAWEGSIGVV
jgi:precorrin-3B methylase